MPFPPVQEWIIAEETSDTRRDESATPGHGTCVASKALGRVSGVSKNSRLIVVKADLSLLGTIDGFRKIVEDVSRNGRQSRAVVVVSRGSNEPFSEAQIRAQYMDNPWHTVRRYLTMLRDMDVLVVAAAGNDGGPINRLPAMFGLLDGLYPPVIAVGAAMLDGERAPFSQYFAQTGRLLWAPGDEVICADAQSDSQYARRTGTSFAAPMVRS